MRAIEIIGTTICGELDCLARGATTLSATIKRQSISGINTIQQEIHKNKVIKTGNFSQLCLVLSRCSTKVVIQKQLVRHCADIYRFSQSYRACNISSLFGLFRHYGHVSIIVFVIDYF